MDENIFNTSDFDFVEPNIGHRNRFEKKINKKRQLIRSISLIGIAVSISIIAFFILPINTTNIHKPANTMQSNVCVNQELVEIEYYYTSQENQRIDEIKTYPIDSSLLNQEVLKLDSIVQQLCRELQTDPHDDRIIGTAILHYQKKIQTLDHILEQLKKINNKKEEQNEEIIL